MIFKDSNKEKGDRGENQAVDFLIENGHKILVRNYRKINGEIDIISEKKQIIYFIEVKSWSHYDFSDLEYVITDKKKEDFGTVLKFF